MSYKLRILSCGGGWQSSAILLMSHLGQLPKLDAAIFSNTGWERKETLLHIEWLRSFVSIPIITVSGGNVRHDLLERDKTTRSMPFWVRNKEGNAGIMRRQCTEKYKVKPVDREIRRMLGIPPGKRAPKGAVELWIGISTDEEGRVWSRPPSQMSSLAYPLLDMVRMSRWDCGQFFIKNGFPTPPKSSCVGCPHRTNSSWRELDNDEFNDACLFDEEIRTFRRIGGNTKEIYLHRKLNPLAEVDLRNGDEKLGQQYFDFVKDEKLNLFVRSLEI